MSVCVVLCEDDGGVCVCVLWDLELQFLILFIHITGWLIGIFRTKSSRSHRPKQGRILLPPQSGQRGAGLESECNDDAGNKPVTLQHLKETH